MEVPATRATTCDAAEAYRSLIVFDAMQARSNLSSYVS
jgi:hypothetical protein